jgi:predicted transcriptional regulator
MAEPLEPHLSKRERQIMDIVFAKGEVTALEVLESFPEKLSYSAVRTFLRILEQKGHVKHRKQENRFVYFPVISTEQASRSAEKRLLTTFFAGSVHKAVVALLKVSETKLSDAEFKRIEAMIQKARKDGR